MTLRKAVYGVLAFWYFAFAAGLIIFPGVLQRLSFPVQRWVAGGFALAVLGGWIAYLVDIFRNPSVSAAQRPAWAIAVGFFGPFAIPFYFFRHVAGSTHPAPPASPAFSTWARAALYMGILSVFATPAPLSIIVAVLALRDLRRHPERQGKKQAVFGLVMGVLGTAGLLLLITRYA